MSARIDYIETQLARAVLAGNSKVIDSLGSVLDSLDEPRPRPGLLPSALWYAEQGLHVFPLKPGLKVPLGGHGCKDATTDADQIRTWWATTPDANVAIATGHLVDVIDIDGPVGVRSWAGLADLPPIVGRVDTPRPGGTHLYIAATGDGNAAGIWPGVDYRGLGGYVVAPPSINSEGVVYSWARPLDLVAA